MATQIMEAKAVISAEDKASSIIQRVGAALDRLVNAGRKVENVGKGFDGVGKGLGVAASNMDKLNAKMERFNSLGARTSRIMREIKTATSAMAAVELARGTRGLVTQAAKAGSAGAHERVRMEAAGLTPSEIMDASSRALLMSAKFKTTSQTDILHMLRNMTSVVGTYEEATHILEPLLKLRTVAEGAHPDKAAELNEDFDKLIKGMEIKGVTQDLPKFVHYMDGMAKALNVFGDTLRPTDYYEMFKYGRQSTSRLGDRFMLSTAPTFAQEMGGASAGTALQGFFQTLVGGQMKDVAAKELDRLGLLDPGKVIKTKTGAVKGVSPGGVVQSNLAASDPYRWMNEVFLPALTKAKITDPEDVSNEIAAVFRRGNVAQLAGILLSQKSRIEKDAARIEGAQGLEASDTFLQKDPFMAWKGVTEQFNNLLSVAAGPLMQPAADAMNAIAGALSALAAVAVDHPMAASAGLLTAVGAGATASFLAGRAALHGVGAAMGLTGAAETAGAVGGGALPWMARAIPGVGTAATIGTAAYYGGQAASELGGIATGKYWTPKMEGELAEIDNKINTVTGQIEDIRSKSKSPETAEMLTAPLMATLADLKNRRESIDVTGEATVKQETTITVTASSELLRIMDETRVLQSQAKVALSGGNGRGSAGTSTPDVVNKNTGKAGPR
jgi:hypothetical protein